MFSKPHSRRIARSFLACLAACALLVAAAIAAPQPSPSPSYQKRAALAVKALQSWYNKRTGLYRTTGWWNSANAITTLADYEKAVGTTKFNHVFKNTFKAAQKTSPGFINRYYDDEGWWALAWIDVYDRTHDPRYLQMSESIFNNMAGGWSNTCSGGIWWSKDRKYKNAIANELFLSVAAHLARRAATPSSRDAYLAWANREWQWFSHTGMINPHHLINDGLDANCRNNGKTTWTYNQGVVLGGLAELYQASHNRALLTTANQIASAAISSPVLADAHRILREPCEPKCGGDGSQFKGIFIRNLYYLNQVAPNSSYSQFIVANADSIWSGAKPSTYHLGLIWSAPFGEVNASTQSSATDALVAAAALANTR